MVKDFDNHEWIYLDNAATSLPKPPTVAQAVAQALGTMANPGRGAYAPSLAAARTVERCRQLLAELLHAPNPQHIAFTHNATYALNMAIDGLLKQGDHVITTVCVHNSVLRPLYLAEQRGVQVTRLGCDAYGRISFDELENALQTKRTKAVVLAHASNVTGNVIDLSRVSRLAHEYGALLIVDAAQTAGCYPIDVSKQKIDVLCFTGHKALGGPQGVGGVYVREGLTVTPMIVGGSGVHSFDELHPAVMPMAMEAGTLNVHGIAGLEAALQWRKEQNLSVEQVHAHELALAKRLYEGVSALTGVKVYGDWREGSERVGIVTLNVGDEDAGAISDALQEMAGICTRAGAHCAPLLHRALGTEKQGAVRFSVGLFNTERDIDIAIHTLADLIQ